MKISRHRLADYVKTLHKKACRTCSTIIFLHSTNQIIDLWRCRWRCRRQILNSLIGSNGLDLEFYPCDTDDRKRLSSDSIFLMETGFKWWKRQKRWDISHAYDCLLHVHVHIKSTGNYFLRVCRMSLHFLARAFITLFKLKRFRLICKLKPLIQQSDPKHWIEKAEWTSQVLENNRVLFQGKQNASKEEWTR